MKKFVLALGLVLCSSCGGDDNECADPTLCGEICVGSVSESPFAIRHHLTGKTRQEISPPQDPKEITNCFLLPAGTYIVQHGELPDCVPGIDPVVHLRANARAEVFLSWRSK